MRPDHGDRVRRGKRGPAGEQFVQDDAGTVEVRGGPRRPVGGEFRRHVHGRADRHAEPGRRPSLGEPGDPEVGQHRPGGIPAGRVEENVRGLDVLVDDTGPVCHRQGRQDLRNQIDRLRLREPTALAQVAAQVPTVDEVHHDREGAALGHDVADLHQVRVVQSQQHPAFAQKAVDEGRVLGQLGA